jgi:hypothetical protein
LGIYYAQYIIPAPAHIRFRPTTKQALAAVDALAIEGWIDRRPSRWTLALVRGGKVARGAVRSRREAAAAFDPGGEAPLVRLKMPGRLAVLEAQGRTGTESEYEFACEPDGRFYAEHCWEVDVLTSRELLLFEPTTVMSAMDIPCPACKKNARRAAGHEVLLAGQAAALETVPGSTCAVCGAPLDLAALEGVFLGTVGERRLLEAPFYSFAVILAPASKEVPPGRHSAKVPRSLVRALEAAVGVGLRTVGRYT